jgi:hexokinase
MSHLTNAFLVGRAAAELLSEQAERMFSDALSELGKFDAEQRQSLRQFVDQVNERAASTAAATGTATSRSTGPAAADLQVTIDDLRAEIAEVRAELQRYRNAA